ncbi:protein of unknown function [Algoriphagus locisalis]|uniref:DUF4174 domain-containing protein n=1 Tax=Algoriphagus locisalis TaxID=305507 RepID=A0A1I6XL28_9BACT|nr:DUF4174 domain-containing protein [Algoriphagus locisalis]SFT38752.1 protein of unknown function [Algoriphagus locisalis]
MKAFVLLIYLFIMVPDPAKTIEDYKWEKRIVITNFDNEKLDAFLEGKERSIEERKLLFVEFEHDEYIRNTLQDEIDPAGFLETVTQKSPTAEWVLIGLDGGVKASGKRKDFSLDAIFHLIDQMPMRQSEIDHPNSL